MLSSKVQEVYSFVFRIEELQNVIIAVKKQIYTCVCVYIYMHARYECIFDANSS